MESILCNILSMYTIFIAIQSLNLTGYSDRNSQIKNVLLSFKYPHPLLSSPNVNNVQWSPGYWCSSEVQRPTKIIIMQSLRDLSHTTSEKEKKKKYSFDFCFEWSHKYIWQRLNSNDSTAVSCSIKSCWISVSVLPQATPIAILGQ